MLAALKVLEWRQADLARAVGVTQNTVSRWQVVPPSVAAFLEMAVIVKRAWSFLQGRAKG